MLALVSAYPYAVEPGPLPAALWTAHGGQAAGAALARVLAGDVSPAGRLPQTWYADDADLPDLLDYDVIGARQTYLYFEGDPLFPFGHGLSYASFSYADLAVRVEGGSVHVAFTVANTGAVSADEVAQLYTRAVEPSVVRPRRELLGSPPGAARARREDGAVLRGPAVRVRVLGRGARPVAAGVRPLRPPGRRVQRGRPAARDRRPRRASRPRPRQVLEGGLAAVDFDEQSGSEIVDRAKTSGDAVTPVGRRDRRTGLPDL